MSDLKGVPKRVILTGPARTYPTTLIAYAELVVQDGMVVKDRHGMNREATPEDLASCKTLTPAEAKVLVDVAAWRGKTPAEGTRRAIVLEAIRKGEVLSDAEALEIADTVEVALLGSRDEERDLVDFDRVHNLLDNWGILRHKAEDSEVTRSLHERVSSLIERLRRTEEDLDTEQHRVAPAVAESKVPSGTRDLRVVLEDVTEVGKPPEYRFIEIDNQDGASVSFPMVNSSTGSLKEIVIPYARDDAWVGEVATQAAGAAFGVALEDHPDYVFPTERVSERVRSLLRDFDIDVDEPRAEESLEHGRHEANNQVWPKDSPQYRRVMAGSDDAPGGDDPAATIKFLEDEVERYLTGREEARSGEGRCAEERDCAFALLRWLLPVTVAKRLDS